MRTRHPVAAALGAAAILLPVLTTGQAMATGPSYPGETLSVVQNGPAVVGREANFTASGTNADDDAGGFNLDVFSKDPRVDPTCGTSDNAEQSAWGGDFANETHPVVGAVETVSPGPFSVPFKILYSKPGPQLICAYSTWAYDTAAAATLSITVQATAAQAKPVATKRPHVTRSGKRLTCRKGRWTGASRFAYRWTVGGKRRAQPRRAHLAVTHALKGKAVKCTVAATNAAGTTTATSPAFHVH